MCQAHLAGVAPLEAALLAEHVLHAVVVILGVEAKVVRPDPVVPVVAESGQGTRLLSHVVLGVATIGAEREQLHQLAGEVLVRRVLPVLRPRQPQQHRRVTCYAHNQIAERPERVLSQHLVLMDHQALGADPLVRRREPVVPYERHALGQGAVRADHPVEPPQMVVSPSVGRRERLPVLVVGRRATEPLRMAWPGERLDRALQPLLRAASAPRPGADRTRPATAAARPARARSGRCRPDARSRPTAACAVPRAALARRRAASAS